MAFNIAFKCTYNNGGKDIYIGFAGTCTDDIIKWNIEQGRSWCSNPDCDCRNYYDKGFRGKRPIDPCYESGLFIDWTSGAGWDHYGVRGNAPRYIRNTEPGKIAIITTRLPGEQEKDRKIVGIYKIGEVYSDDESETRVSADEYYRIKLPEEEAKELYFWDYYKNKNSKECVWGQGLFRYMNDLQVAQILKAVSETIKNEAERLKVIKLLEEFESHLNIDIIRKPIGARKEIINRTLRIAENRKYGSGGEGFEHKKLKEWVAAHPKILGLSNITKVKIEEHYFPSGDLPDIVFEYNDGMYAVVEIETLVPLPGAYQALKYKALMCAEMGLPLNSSKVKAFLVAWNIPDEINYFCKTYGIEAKSIKI